MTMKQCCLRREYIFAFIDRTFDHRLKSVASPRKQVLTGQGAHRDNARFDRKSSVTISLQNSILHRAAEKFCKFVDRATGSQLSFKFCSLAIFLYL